MWHNLALDLRICSWDALESSTLSSSHRSTSATYGLFQNKKTQTFTETFGLIFYSHLKFSKPLSGASAHYPGFEPKSTNMCSWRTRHRRAHQANCSHLLEPGHYIALLALKGTWLTMPSAIRQEDLTHHAHCDPPRGNPSSRKILRVCCVVLVESTPKTFWYVFYAWHRHYLKKCSYFII